MELIRWLVGAMLFAATLVPVGTGKALEAYDLVGEDKQGDGQFVVASGANYPACETGFTCLKYDAIRLEMGSSAEEVHVKLSPAASYKGTSGIIYAVHFQAAGKKYLTCWNIHSLGTTGQPVDAADQENTLACSRFAGETQVGPATRAAGVDVSTTAPNIFVDWGFAPDAIGGATELTDIVAEIWARGPSNCCVGSTSQSPYLWNLADRAPDAGTWSYSLGPKAPPLAVAFSIDPQNVTVAPGGTAEVALGATVTGNGTLNYTWSVEGTPEGWAAAVTPANGSATGGAEATAHNLTVNVPADAQNQTVDLTVVLTGDGNLTARGNVTVTVDTSLTPPASSTPSQNSSAPATPASENATAAADGSIPALTIPGLMLGTVVAVLAVRRVRRET